MNTIGHLALFFFGVSAVLCAVLALLNSAEYRRRKSGKGTWHHKHEGHPSLW